MDHQDLEEFAGVKFESAGVPHGVYRFEAEASQGRRK